MHIYGAYASQKVMQLNNAQERFIVKGRAEDARESIANYRVLLAPIQFGAGVKGKLIDAMQTGTPSVTSSIGAEAMKGELPWNGYIEDNDALYVEKAILLYTDQEQWNKAQCAGTEIINQRYNKTLFLDNFHRRLQFLIMHLENHRRHNFMGQLLQHHSHQSTKYMSLWIEEKNKES